ncbi:translation initiation factor IF-2 [Tissierella creatinophila]|uniref:Translation initiation factor IF-2 n=1 Tax=Tissierella creatinophila DSM 6911 TaxID=1123403 RepID=A0A1U7M371_TISCR|nr:translation initiation factor IF-2 [Tissierella creatinophila]OLS01762.1 translation initiation factor IF-2 [Tissierella creatinophila DSM 6911]
MAKMRIYELAKELDISSKELMEKIEDLDINAKSHMSSLSGEETELIKELLGNEEEEIIKTKQVQENKNTNIKEEDSNIINAEESQVDQDETNTIEIGSEIIVKELADILNVNPSQVITKLISQGIMASQNQSIDFDTASLLAIDFGVELSLKEETEETEIEEEIMAELDYEDKEEDLKPRPPVVTVMGHVDHGKTSLLDAIRESHVTTSEAGGITQHIGASVARINDKKLVFLDTPGHEAFTSMRARGAKVTDIAILVVAADDGVMPQTLEAISHAKAAGVPIIVAINKIDKPTANLDRIKQELVENGLLPEDWGGDTITVPVSAKNREGIDELLEMVLLVAEIQELKANPNRKAIGIVIEAQLDKGKGPLATILVQKGTLKVGDMVVSGTASGRIRAMLDHKGKQLKKATPSIPAVILGLSEVPNAGDLIYAVENEKIARFYASEKKNQLREQQFKLDDRVTLENLFETIKEGDIQDLNIIIKADVRGSMEALSQSLQKLDIKEEVKVNMIHGGIGGITESDIMLAAASNAIVIGFNVRPNLNALEVAKREKVDIRTYRVIYEAIEDIQKAVKGMLIPDIVEEVLGRAEIRATFRLPNGNSIAGIYIVNGKITRNSKIRLLRDDIVMFEGTISSLKRFKDDVREVASGYEAGIGLENYNDLKEGDMLEAYILKEVQR